VNQTNVTHLNRDPSSYVGGGFQRATQSGGVQQRPPFSHSGDKPKFVAKGHDAQLQDAQINKHPTTISLMSGDKVNGIVVKRDKFTITLRYTGGTDAGLDEIFYKHAIESVLIKRESSN